MDGQWPQVDSTYCNSCMQSGGCEACPRPRLLPEAKPATYAFMACETQWRVGFSGATGLDYTACIQTIKHYLPLWREQAAPDDPIHRLRAVEVFDGMRAIERTWLSIKHTDDQSDTPETPES